LELSGIIINDMFKTCNSCGDQWETREHFLSDPDVTAKGYQIFFTNLTQGLFLFNHSCGTTLAIEAEALLDLYNGTIYDERRPAKDRHCPGRCMMENIMSPCSDRCKCAFISTLLNQLKNWEKISR